MSTLPAPSPETSSVPAEDAHARWRFLRDVLVFQVKLFIGNLHNFIFIPISLAAAAADLLFKSERHGARFYKAMEWARHADEAIDLYSPLREDDEGDRKSYSVDAVVSRIEDVIVREYAKGGTTASVKTAVDRTLDKIQRETPSKFNPEDVVKRAAEHIKERMKRNSGAE
ncbi:MAG TPA: hypothetical protein VGG69_11930 [Rhizomicrobium sp.]